MTTSDRSIEPNKIHAPSKDSRVTVAAIGVLAFVATDVAHEVVGHGIGLLIAGGRAGTLTTTKLIYAAQLPAPLWRIFDLGGPIGNLAWAALCLALQRLTPGAAPRRRLFLWAGAMFALFWEFGYLMKCGVSGRGDAMALIDGLSPAGDWRALLFLTGLILYRSAIRLLAADLHFIVSLRETEWRARVRRLLWTLYLAGGVTACAGAMLDPRGASEIFNSGAASSFIACVGLGLVPALFARYPEKAVAPADPIRRNIPLIVFTAVVFLLFVLVLGPGIPVSL
jgi:hypothetical protein